MKKKNNLFKNIFYIFFAFCFFSVGFMTLNIQNENTAMAEDMSNSVLTNDQLPDYFSADEYLDDGLADTVDQINASAIEDTFLYFTEGGIASYYKISLQTNKSATDAPSDIYKWVYYPDVDNKAVFQYYNINSVSLYINGVDQDLAIGNFVDDSLLSFPAKDNVTLQSFDITFSNSTSPAENEISILDESGNVKEGVYELSLTYTLFTCTDGGSTMAETQFTDQNMTVNYKFYVLNRDNYIDTDAANVTWNNFDHEIPVSAKFPSYSNFLYSNYSSDKNSADSAYSMPYIEYDYTRFELEITNSTKTTSLVYDKDAKAPVLQGDNLVDKFITSGSNCKVYFTDTDEYQVIFKPIKLVEYETSATSTEVRKYSLDNLAATTKQIRVYVYGYQAKYTDFDGDVTENNTLPAVELKDYNKKIGKYENGADITSGFLNSSATFSQTAGSSTFLIDNIVNYIADAGISAQITNQPPIDMTTNAVISSNSYIYSTTKVSSAYTEFSGSTLNGQTLYRSKFTGLTDSSAGKYIYIISYTYDNYYENENTLNKSKVFYQVFYFEIIQELPNISIVKVDAEGNTATNVPSGTYTNQSVQIINENTENLYNKDVRVQVYVQDYANNFLSAYGGSSGIEYEGQIFAANGRYTVRLFFENEIKNNSAKLEYNYSNKGEKAYFKQRTFTIDKTEISNINGRNVTAILNTTNFKIGTNLENFVTNQSFVVSWDEKDSGAQTYAYYRYFPIEAAQYYSKNTDSNNVSNLLTYMLYGEESSYLPINSLLDLETDGNKWDKYYGNTDGINNTISTEYVLSDAGLYLIDIYDEAGNHSVEIFMIDNTSPIFALENQNTGNLEITTSSMYVTEPSTLYWSKNKAFYISNFDTISFTSAFSDIDSVTEDMLKDAGGNYYNIYTTYENKISLDLFKKIYNTLYAEDYMKTLQCTTTVEADSGVDNRIGLVGTYAGYYMTIPIETTSFYITRGISNTTPTYQKQTNVFSYEISVDKEFTYTVLIRDKSNTKKDLTSADDAMVQFTNYSSASQSIRVSHDSSHFVIQYTPTGSSTSVDLTPNMYDVKDAIDASGAVITDPSGNAHQTQIAYLSPTSLEKIFNLSFTPTIKDEDMTIQVDKVEIKYYAYEETTKSVGDVKYNFYRLSDSASIDTVYDFSKNGENFETVEYEIRPTTNYTREGKYEITRTYYLGTDTDTYEYNSNDYYQRTYVFYVDRNEVISPATRVDSADGSTHLESLVGGDIFVSMFDNGKDADLVVTFPNSDEGNTDGPILYNNGSNIRSLFTTNMLPVNIYIPQYKYTTYVEKVVSEVGYEFNVNFDYYYTTQSVTYLYKNADCNEALKDDEGTDRYISDNIYLDVIEIVTNTFGQKSAKVTIGDTICYIAESDYANLRNQNFYNEENPNSLIAEYALYAEIYKNGTESSNIIAKTAKGYTDPQLQYITSKNGFLQFYTAQNPDTPVSYFSDPGTYYVKIYQGRFGIEKGSGNDNDYEKSMTFCFEIKNTTPDFEVQKLGTTLNSVDNTYFTNQTNVQLVWEPGSTFMAEIDIDKITFETSSGTYQYKDHPEFFTSGPILSNGLWSATLDLENLGIYNNGNWVKITMQYKNHDKSLDKNGNNLYKTVTKTIKVDLSAPNENIQTLVSKATGSGLIASLTESALRTYYTAKEGEIATTPETTCYNVSNSTNEYFKYYSYTVTSDFINSLAGSSDADVTYIRMFENGTKYHESTQERETPHGAFSASQFTELSKFSGFEAGNYYEIVESDYAGNLTIYTVYVASYDNASDTLLSLKNAGGETRNYTVSDYLQALTYENATHSLYALTGYELESVNYFGDEWAQFRITTRDTSNGLPSTKTIMMTPWDEQRVYVFDSTGAAEMVYLRDLIKASKNIVNKDVLAIYDRCSGATTNFYINIQSTQFKPTLTSVQDQEFITFAMPTDVDIQSTLYGTTYLTNLKITAKLATGDTVLYDKENKLGFASLWTNSINDEVMVEYDSAFNRITFKLNPELNFVANTKIIYEYTDNFGRTTTKIHLYKEPVIFTEIQSNHLLYSYYDENGKLIYLTKDGFKYLYNDVKEYIKVFELNPTAEGGEGKELVKAEDLGKDLLATSQKAFYDPGKDISTGVSTITINFNSKQTINEVATTVLNYDDTYILKVYDADTDTEVSQIYFKLYNELVFSNSLYNDGSVYEKYAGDFKLLDANGNDITQKIIAPADLNNLGYFSEVRLIYNTSEENFIPVKFSVSNDLKTWEEVNTGTKFKCQTDDMEKYFLKIWYDETYLKNEFGTTDYIFGEALESQIFEFNLSSLTATYWIEKTIGGTTEIVAKDDTMFVAEDGTQFSNHYIVNIAYADKDAVKIKTNEELGIRYFEDPNGLYSYGSSVKSQVYLITNTKDANGNYVDLGNIPAFETKIIITYIPSSDNFVEEFYTYNMNGVIDTTENLVNLTSKSVVISQDFATLNTIQLQWSKYYGFPQNTIGIKLVKDGVELTPTTYSKAENGKDYNYIYLTHSGKYQIYLEDKSGNVQKFNRGSAGQTDSLTFIFLKDVPFTVTYVNPETQEEETSTPIQQAVYNGTVKLNIDASTRSEFYSLDGYPVISVKRNGVEYTDFETKDNTAFTFTENGYYQVTFSATSNIQNVGKIRQETYEFTILDPNEYRYSYIFNSYSNYYVEKVVKDGKDVTANLAKSLDAETITIKTKNGLITYLKELPLSYLDEKTGAGTYLITINSNDKFYQNSDFITSWTYQVKIQVGSAPIRISLAQGEETTDNITFTFNAANIYEEMGNCYVRVVKYVDNEPVVITQGVEKYLFEINADSPSEQMSKEISASGTYYIQIVSMGDNLLYSYKVVKNEPMNGATIAIIVIAVVVALIIIFIIIKLRKRISVK